MKNNKIMGMLFLDVAKAFNCINHEILYTKMERAGLGPMVIQWFKSYLNRTQQVLIQGKVFDIVSVNTGIAQGTVLGPIMFIFYINDIFECVEHVKMNVFADDCVMYCSGNNWLSVKGKIQSDFDRVIDWTFRNNLRLNATKTKAILFGTRNKLSKIGNPEHITMGTRMIDFVHNYTYLGIIVDDVMSSCK